MHFQHSNSRETLNHLPSNNQKNWSCMHVDCTDPGEQSDRIPHESISPDRPFSQTACTHPVNSNSDETDVTHGKLINFFFFYSRVKSQTRWTRPLLMAILISPHIFHHQRQKTHQTSYFSLAENSCLNPMYSSSWYTDTVRHRVSFSDGIFIFSSQKTDWFMICIHWGCLEPAGRC